MASRSIWSGSISFGLVNVPVKLYTATSPKTVRFHQLNSKTGSRIQQKRVDASTGELVEYENIVKGYEITKDNYVIVTPEELAGIAPKQTKTILIEQFIPATQINAMTYDTAYWIAPDGPGASKAYRLLTSVMANAESIALGVVILRSKQQPCALRVNDAGQMFMSTMLYPDEIVDPDKVIEIDPATPEPSEAEVTMAGQLVAALTRDFDPSAMRDEHRDKILALIERKAAGETIMSAGAQDTPVAAPDLMSALAASLNAVAKPEPEVTPEPVKAKRARKPAVKKVTA